MSQKELNKLLGKWQKILRLQDWAITVVFKEEVYVRGRDAEASCHLDKYSKSASISIGKSNCAEAVIFRLIHELIHLHLIAWSVEDYSHDELAQEQAVNLLASAFVGLDRKEK